MHIYVYVYIYIYIYIYIYTYTCAQAQIHIYICIYMYVYAYIYMPMCAHIYVCIYIYTYIHTYIHVYIYICIYLCRYKCTCMDVYPGIIIPVIEIRADWPAFSSALGFRSWSHKTCPCFCCTSDKSELDRTDGVSLDSGPWEFVNEDTRRSEIERCTVLANVATQADLDALESALHLDKRKKGFLGRVLRYSVVLSTGQTLYQGDRLEPTMADPDTHRCRTKSRPESTRRTNTSIVERRGQAWAGFARRSMAKRRHG